MHTHCPLHLVPYCLPYDVSQCVWWAQITCEFPDINSLQIIYIHKYFNGYFWNALWVTKVRWTRSNNKTFKKWILFKILYVYPCSICHCQAVVFVAMVWVILFPFVIVPVHDWLVQHVHAGGEDVSVVSHSLSWVVIFW